MLLIIAAFVVAGAWAQPAFENLATNYDGSVLYFSSWLRTKGTEQYPHPKLFVWDEARGLRLFAQKPLQSAISDIGTWSSTPYRYERLSVSADGRTTAATAVADCNFGGVCVTGFERYQAEIVQSGSYPHVTSGAATFSPKWAICVLEQLENQSPRAG